MIVKNKKVPTIEKIRSLTKSEELLTHIGRLVSCDICHKQVVFNRNWLMTADKDTRGNYINKRAVCPGCQPAVVRTGAMVVTI
jgi:hypothetical protein